MVNYTKQELDEIRRKAEEMGKSGIVACKKAVGVHNLTGLAMCEDLNPDYLSKDVTRGLQQELSKCLEHGWCDSNYVTEKVRLTVCHLADLYRFTPLNDPYKNACQAFRDYRNKK